MKDHSNILLRIFPILFLIIFSTSTIAQIPRLGQQRTENLDPRKRIETFTQRNMNERHTMAKVKPWKPDNLKSGLAKKYKLDSLVSFEFRDIYTFDDNGNMTSYAFYNWDDNTIQWIGDEKAEYTYDNYGNETSWTSYTWDTLNSSWVGVWNGEYTNNEYGEITSAYYYFWDEDYKQWDIAWKWENTYDENGKILLDAWFYWDGNNQWIEYDFIEYAYDENGNKTFEAYYWYDWDSDQWIGSYKYEYTYDEQGNMTSETYYYYYNVSTNQWEPSSKYEYTYDEKGTLKFFDVYYWNFDTEQLDPSSRNYYYYDVQGNLIADRYYDWYVDYGYYCSEKYEYTYDENNNMTTNTGSYRDGENYVVFAKKECSYNESGLLASLDTLYQNWYTDQWEGIRVKYTYDVNRNLTSWTTHEFNPDDSTWIGIEKKKYFFDDASELKDLMVPQAFYIDNISSESDSIVPLWNTVNNKLMKRITYIYRERTEEWIFDDELKYYYSEQFETGKPDITEGGLTIYPNPATDYILVSSDDLCRSAMIEIFDIQGKVVLRQEMIDDHQRISVKHLDTGIYIYKLTNNSITYRGKIIVE